MQHRPPAIFIADSLGLDFLNSVATPVDTPVDWLESGDGLVKWLAQAKLVPANALDELKARAMPGELDKVADQARALREWFRGFVRKHMGRPLASKALQELGPLNKLLERDEAFSQISRHHERDDDRLELRVMRRWRSPESLLLPIGEALAKFVCEEDFADVKACEGHSCTLMFADHTRRRARRWCSMAICGNRAKQAAHRKPAQEQALTGEEFQTRRNKKESANMAALPLIVFDVNETLLDLETMEPTFQRIFGEKGAMRLWFANLILYSAALTVAGCYVPFTDIGTAVMKMLADTRGIKIGDNDKKELTEKFSTMPPHPEVPAALRKLRDAGFRLFCLTDNLLEVQTRQLAHGGIVDLFERRFSADGVEAP